MICIANSTYNYIGATSWSTLPCIMGTFQIPSKMALVWMAGSQI
jgi:hypothetical protein